MIDDQGGEPGSVPRRLLRQARHLYALRRRRDALLGELFGEPTWDMLLELFIQNAEGRKTPVKNLCLASCAPTSTAVRRIDDLLARGLVTKSTDEDDARRSLVSLTERGWKVMATLLQTTMSP